MLVFSLNRSDLTRPFDKTDLGIAAGESYIHPLRHPMLDSCRLRTHRKTALIIREKGKFPLRNLALDEAAFNLALRKSANWPLQYAILVIDHSEGSLSLRQNPLWGVAPIYLVEQDDRLHGHWDPKCLYPLIDHIDLGRAALFLRNFDTPYGRRTLFPELTVLSAGAKASWGIEQTLNISYPPPAPSVRVRQLKQDAEPAQIAIRILQDSLQRHIHSDVTYGAELSGGLDSSLVAISASRHLPQLHTYGIALPDTDGQDGRRNDIIAQYGFVDTYTDLQEDLPFAPSSARWNSHKTVPWEEIYEEAVQTLLQKAQNQGVQAIFTGFGGDELCSVYTGEPTTPQEFIALEPASQSVVEADFLTPQAIHALQHCKTDEAPQAIVDSSSLESAAFGSALYLRHSIWPIHPLCTPELVRFCQSLPWEWRVGRTVERKMLKSLGCPASVHACRTVDSFLNAMASGLREAAQSKIIPLFQNPLLAELGLVRQDRLLAQFQDWCRNGMDEDVIPFYSAIALEKALQQTGKPL